MMVQKLEKEIDGQTAAPQNTGEKKQDLYQQLLTLHSDITKIGKGVEGVEEKVNKLTEKDPNVLFFLFY